MCVVSAKDGGQADSDVMPFSSITSHLEPGCALSLAPATLVCLCLWPVHVRCHGPYSVCHSFDASIFQARVWTADQYAHTMAHMFLSVSWPIPK